MDEQELKNLVNRHQSIRRMARAVGVSASTIRYWLRVWGMKSEGDRSLKTKPLCRNCGAPVRRRPNVYCSVSCQWRYIRSVRIKDGTAGIRLLKTYLLERRENKCEMCSSTHWMDKPIPLELDHKDGDATNNRLDNLRLVCPNCHAQTETYKNRNIGHGRHYRRERYSQGQSY